ncbi:MAG: hypothetical protein K2X81_16085 [Candidatus Obscuribacterales bacterium]|nr:hypothetical protein [Candidatus Obscuribacterales bacterium]
MLRSFITGQRIIVATFASLFLSGNLCALGKDKPLSFDVEPDTPLSEQAIKVLSQKVEIFDEMTQLKALESSGNPSQALNMARLENTINKRIAIAYFDSSAFIADLTSEISAVRDRRNVLENARNRLVNTTNTVNFLSRGAIGLPATAYSINPKHLPTNGNILGTTANGTSTLLSLVSIVELRGGKSKDSESASLLAPLFLNDVSHTRYTPKVWLYLTSQPLEGTGPSHQQKLVRAWIKSGLAPDPASTAGRQRLRQLLGVEPNAKLSISDLQKCEKMLDGLKTTVLQMNKGLEQLTAAI